MPFVKGDNTYQKLGGRKGYNLEQKELERMSMLLRRYLTLAETIESQKANLNQKEAFDRLRPLVLKIMDKLHANKQDIKLDWDKPLLVKQV